MGQHRVEMSITCNLNLEVPGGCACGFDIKRKENYRRVRWGPGIDFPCSQSNSSEKRFDALLLKVRESHLLDGCQATAGVIEVRGAIRVVRTDGEEFA